MKNAVEEFLNSNIRESLFSENPLIRLLAIVDRRVGKRTLKEIKASIPQQPVWLKYFYELRVQAEMIH
ncbi:SF0329 family protein [Variimorphobacter saccharofermentans]